AGETKFDPAARARALAGLLQEETIALVRIDFTRTDLEGFEKVLPADLLGRVKAVQAAFRKAGGAGLVVPFSTGDLAGISFVHVPLKEGADAEALSELLKKHLPPGTVVRKRDGALVAGSPEALGRGKGAARADLPAAVKAAGDTVVQVLFLPTADQRRVIAEV